MAVESTPHVPASWWTVAMVIIEITVVCYLLYITMFG